MIGSLALRPLSVLPVWMVKVNGRVMIDNWTTWWKGIDEDEYFALKRNMNRLRHRVCM